MNKVILTGEHLESFQLGNMTALLLGISFVKFPILQIDLGIWAFHIERYFCARNYFTTGTPHQSLYIFQGENAVFI